MPTKTRKIQNLSGGENSLLTANDAPPFRFLNENSDKPYLLVCEHAGTLVPEKLGDLGLDESDFDKHYAVDVGAREMIEGLADKLKAPAIVANYSRLVVDLNRRVSHPSAFPSSGEGQPVPGNLNLSEEDRNQRIHEIYDPFHAMIQSWIETKEETGVIPALITVHSYTPVFYGQERPWDVAVLWVQDDRMPEPFMEHFRNKGYNVGDNEPYDAKILRGGTMEIHGDGRRIPNLLIEYRNDHLKHQEKREKMLADTVEALESILADESLYCRYDGPDAPHDIEAEQEYFEQVMRTMIAHEKEKSEKGE